MDLRDEQMSRAQLLEELAAARQEGARASWELQKEAALRQLARRAAKVTTEGDTEAVLVAIRESLQELGVPFEGCGVNVVDAGADPPAVHFHAMMAGESWQEPQSGNAGVEFMLRIWQSQEVAYRRDLEAEDPHGEAARIRWRRPVRSVLDVPFSHGTLAVNSTRPDAFSPVHVELLRELAQVLSEAFAHRDQGLRSRGSALARIRGEMWTMAKPDDIANLVSAIAEELNRLGVPYRSCAVNAIDTAQDPDGMWGYHVTGGRVAPRYGSLPDEGVATILDLQRAGVPAYRTDLWASDSHAERERILAAYGHPVRSVVDVPFSAGTLAVTSPEPEAFTERHIEILQDMAQVLSQGFQRREELRAKERRARELEEHARAIEERDALLATFHRVGLVAQQALTPRGMVSALSRQVVEAGLFRSLVVSLVDREHNCIEEVYAWEIEDGDHRRRPADRLNRRALDGTDILARVVRSGRLEVVVGWDDEVYTHRDDDRRDWYSDKVAYFIPIITDDEVVAVLATGSARAEKEGVMARIETMQPLLDQVAIALKNARLYEALRQERDFAERLVETTQAIVLLLDTEGRIVRYNRYLEQLTGVALSEVRGRDWVSSFVPAREQARIRAVQRRAVTGTSTRGNVNAIVAKDGSEHEIEWYDTTLRGADGEVIGVLATGQDMTERRRLEQEVIHLERMRVSGELAAGVSHNLNNLLTAVLAPAQILLRKSVDVELRHEAETILAAGRRAAELVSRLNRAVRSTDEGAAVPVSLNEQVGDVLEMSRPRWRDEPQARGVAIDVATDLGEVPDISGSAAEVSDAILNLVLNAIEAMPGGGTIAVTTRADHAGALLTVRDTGEGMDEATRRRVFEPFFTTKRDVGSGLGLSTVHGLVTRQGGTIEVASSPGEGSAFTLWFPAWSGSTAIEPGRETTAGRGRPGRILVVEDDEAIARVLHRLLSPTHSVTVVHDGREALSRHGPGQQDVALIDLSMPGLAGDQVAAQMRRLDPHLVTVLITGWVLEPDDARLAWFDLHLPKPFSNLGEVEGLVTQAIELHDARRREAAGPVG